MGTFRPCSIGVLIVFFCLVATFERWLASHPASPASDFTFPGTRNMTSGLRQSRNEGPSSNIRSNGTLTKLLVLPYTSDDDISWLRETLPDLPVVAYCASNGSADHHPPVNKGHEVMNYLTFIIDHYDNIQADVVIFMHAHRYALHNNDLFDFDAAQMISRLRPEHVIQQAYFNMRCRWTPGCPLGLDPRSRKDELSRQEEAVLLESWRELFPQHQPPASLAQACCAQYAVSRETIRARPRSYYIYFRDWTLKTPLSTYIAGRIWEYTWQFLFAQQSVFCPSEHDCYCDGYGLCLEGDDIYAEVVMERANQSEQAVVDDNGGRLSRDGAKW